MWSGGALATDVYLSEGAQAILHIPTIDMYLHLSPYLGTLYAKKINPVTGASTDLGAVSGSFASGIDFSTMPGASWSPELGKVLLWNQSSNKAQISTLTPSVDGLVWTAGTLTVSGSNTETGMASAGNGTFGLFGYSSALKGCYLINSHPGRVYFYATE
jgi:hypothetical protein